MIRTAASRKPSPIQRATDTSRRVRASFVVDISIELTPFSVNDS